MAKNVRREIEKTMLKGRSPAYRWLTANYAELLPLLTQRRTPWKKLADAARGDGVTGPENGGPSRQTMQKAGSRLLADKARQQAPALRQARVLPQSKEPPHVDNTQPRNLDRRITKPKAGDKSIWGTKPD